MVYYCKAPIRHFTKWSDYVQICHILTTGDFLTWLESLKEIWQDKSVSYQIADFLPLTH